MNTKVLATLIAIDCLLAGGWFVGNLPNKAEEKAVEPEEPKNIVNSQFAYVWDSGNKTVIELTRNRKERSLYWTFYKDVSLEVLNDSVILTGLLIERKFVEFSDKISEANAISLGIDFEPENLDKAFWSRSKYLETGIYEIEGVDSKLTVSGEFVIKND